MTWAECYRSGDSTQGSSKPVNRAENTQEKHGAQGRACREPSPSVVVVLFECASVAGMGSEVMVRCVERE